MANHSTFYCWLKNIVKLSKCQGTEYKHNWIELIDADRNRIVLYGDSDDKLFNAFRELLVDAEIEID